MSKKTRKLSKKETEQIVELYLSGSMTPENIALKFGVSYHNVNYHVTRHFQKLEKQRNK